MSEISTRIWLDEELWQKVRNRAIAEETTARELIPRLIGQAVSGPSPKVRSLEKASTAETPPVVGEATVAGPPVIELSDIYRCGVCGGDVKMGGLTIHMGKHMKERQAQQAERSE